MLTYPATVAVEFARDERAAYRPYRATVARIQELSPSFRRVTFTGPDMHYFAPHGLDQRIKLVFPVDGRIGDLGLDDESALVEGSWYARWRELPDAARNPFRTYTVRAVRPAERELDVDFVAHGDGGPAAQWLQSAAVGDELVIVGPDARSLSSATGMDWHPGSARDVLLAGDETAAPAICSILESLPAGVRAAAFIEVPTGRDILTVSSSADVTVTWVTRSDGQRLEPAVRAWAAESDAYAPVIAPTRQVLADIDVDVELLWDSPEESAGQFYAWVAGESATVKSLRRFLVSELGVDRKRVAFMGYWRLGKSEAQG